MIAKNMRQSKKSGFTIVELLIVIVIIAILAAISVMTYGSITARANTTNAKSAASIAVKKIEAYAAETSSNGGGDGNYPTTAYYLTSADTSRSYYLSGVSFTTSVGVDGTKPASPSTINYYTCSASGAAVSYYDYGTKAWVQLFVGSGTAPTCAYKAGNATS